MTAPSKQVYPLNSFECGIVKQLRKNIVPSKQVYPLNSFEGAERPNRKMFFLKTIAATAAAFYRCRDSARLSAPEPQSTVKAKEMIDQDSLRLNLADWLERDFSDIEMTNNQQIDLLIRRVTDKPTDKIVDVAIRGQLGRCIGRTKPKADSQRYNR